jgi:hypothetical protein
MSQQKINHEIGWLYCYKSGTKAVYINRWDQVIKEFETYEEAEKYANNNPHLIDIKIKKQKVYAKRA